MTEDIEERVETQCRFAVECVILGEPPTFQDIENMTAFGSRESDIVRFGKAAADRGSRARTRSRSFEDYDFLYRCHFRWKILWNEVDWLMDNSPIIRVR